MSGGDIEKARASGVREGQIDTLLKEHTARLDRINGSIDRFTVSIHALAEKVRGMDEGLGETVRDGLAKLESEIRTLQEEGRLAAERVVVAAATLAKETERRRVALAEAGTTGDRKFTRGQQLATLVLGIVVLVVTVYLARNSTTP